MPINQDCPRRSYAAQRELGSEATSAWLEVRRGRARQPLRKIKGPVFLMGKASDCDLVLGDPHFPELHSYLFVTTQGVLLRHLGVGPTVSIGGHQTDSAELVDGDLIQMASYEFRIRIPRPLNTTDLGPEPSGEMLRTRHGRKSRQRQRGLRHAKALLDEIQQAIQGVPQLGLFIEPETDLPDPDTLPTRSNDRASA